MKSTLDPGLSQENFIIKEFINQGGFGKVYKCTHNNDLYARKVVEITGSENDNINKELEILKKIKSKKPIPSSIIKYFGHNECTNEKNNTEYQLYFEYLSDPLDKVIDGREKLKKNFTISELMSFYHEILSGMAFLQSIGITHRDLKPGNLMLDFKQKVKIIDFGISEDIKIGEMIKTNNIKELTSHVNDVNLEVKGSLSYLSPEMLLRWIEIEQNPRENINITVNPYKSDVFSFGLIMLEAATLRKIKNGKNNKNVGTLIQKTQENLEFFANQDVREEEEKDFEFLKTQIKKCLAPNHERRPDFISLLKEDFMNIQSEKIRFHIFINSLIENEISKFFTQTPNEKKKQKCSDFDLKHLKFDENNGIRRMLLECEEKVNRKDIYLKRKDAEIESLLLKEKSLLNEINSLQMKIDEVQFQKESFFPKDRDIPNQSLKKPKLKPLQQHFIEELLESIDVNVKITLSEEEAKITKEFEVKYRNFLDSFNEILHKIQETVLRETEELTKYPFLKNPPVVEKHKKEWKKLNKKTTEQNGRILYDSKILVSLLTSLENDMIKYHNVTKRFFEHKSMKKNFTDLKKKITEFGVLISDYNNILAEKEYSKNKSPQENENKRPVSGTPLRRLNNMYRSRNDQENTLQPHYEKKN